MEIRFSKHIFHIGNKTSRSFLVGEELTVSVEGFDGTFWRLRFDDDRTLLLRQDEFYFIPPLELLARAGL